MFRTSLCAAIGLPLSVFACHKQVLAAPIVSADPAAHTLTILLPSGEHHTFTPAVSFFARAVPSPGDYFVVYEDGYQSHSPKAIFEGGYKGVPDQTSGLDFGQAIAALKTGRRVAREGWNGKGMFLFLVPGSTFKVNRAPLLGIYPEGTEISYCPHIDMKTANGMVVPWLASQTDLLAEDWTTVG